MTLSLPSVSLVKNKPRLFQMVMANLMLLCSVSGCSPAADSEQDAKDRLTAEANLNGMLEAKHQRRVESERRQAAQEQEAQQLEEARLAEAQKPHYDPRRLAAAAGARPWAAITVPDFNVKAVFNSSWSNDKLNYRVALLGQQAAIDAFLHSFSAYHVNFADQGGGKIFEFTLLPSDFQSSNRNNGIPTMESIGAVDCELPRYEQSVQWNLTWSN